MSESNDGGAMFIVYNDWGSRFGVCRAVETDKTWRRADGSRAYPRVFDKRRVRGAYPTEAEAMLRIASAREWILSREAKDKDLAATLRDFQNATRARTQEIFDAPAPNRSPSEE